MARGSNTDSRGLGKSLTEEHFGSSFESPFNHDDGTDAGPGQGFGRSNRPTDDDKGPGRMLGAFNRDDEAENTESRGYGTDVSEEESVAEFGAADAPVEPADEVRFAIAEPVVLAAPEDAGPPDAPGEGEGLGQGQGQGQGDGDGDGDGESDQPPGPPTPPDAPLLDADDPNVYSAKHVFSIYDVTGDFAGTTYAVDRTIVDTDGTGSVPSKVSKEGVTLYPIDSEFGFTVTDFIGAEQKERDGFYGEGFVGELPDGNGIAVSDAKTDTFQVPATLGTWLAGLGGNSVKASTEHYSTMQAVLSTQKYPGDPNTLYNLDDDLWIVDYKLNEDGSADLDENGRLQEDDFHHFYLDELVGAMNEAEGFDESSAVEAWRDFNGNGLEEAGEFYKAYIADENYEGVIRNVAVIDFVNNNEETEDNVDFRDEVLNGFGEYGIQDFIEPNESTVLEYIAAGDDYSVTVKDDGKLLYRWGNMVKRPNDVRIDTKIELPDEWKVDENADGFKDSLYWVTAAELIINHTVTNNPNDQVRPEDFENEAAIGVLPSYVEVRDPFNEGNVLWVADEEHYTGTGDLLRSYFSDEDTGVVVEDLDGNPIGYANVDEAGNPIGTVFRDFSLIELAENSKLGEIGALSSDLTGGFTEAYYTTMDREPFIADYNEDGTDYEIGPRWRLQPDKYGQDLPSVVIPQDTTVPPPPKNGEEKYEVGVDTTTVLNLLDWNGTSPMTLSVGWMTNAGGVSGNGVNMTEDFDIAYYVKGDSKPVNLYDAELRMTYEEVAINDAEQVITGNIFENVLVGRGSNVFHLSGESYPNPDGSADIALIGYGSATASGLGHNEIYGFGIDDGDALGLVGFGLDPDNFNIHLRQEVDTIDGELEIFFDAGDGNGESHIATLNGISEVLGSDSFYFALTPQTEPEPPTQIVGTPGDDVLVGLDGDETIVGLQGDDTLDGGLGDDMLFGDEDNDILNGGAGNDTLDGGDGRDLLLGEAGEDVLYGGEDIDVVEGGEGADVLFGGTGGTFELDLLSYSTETGPLTFIFGTTGTDFQEGTSQAVLEDTIGDDFEGVIGAFEATNSFDGSALAEGWLMVGGNLADEMIGGTGADELISFGGDDVLSGGAGSDVFRSDDGNDDLFGGSDVDIFQFDSGDGDDTIHDFEIDLDLIVFFNGTVSPDLSELTFETVDADGIGGVNDGVIRYGTDSITVLGIDGATLEDQANIIPG